MRYSTPDLGDPRTRRIACSNEHKILLIHKMAAEQSLKRSGKR